MSALTERMPTFTRLYQSTSHVFRRIASNRAATIAIRVFLWLVVVLVATRTIATVVLERRLASTVDEVSRKYGSLMPSSLALPSVPAADNQAILFRAAGEALVQTDAEGDLLASVASRKARAADHAEELHVIFEKNKTVLELTTLAAARKRSSWEIDYKEGNDAKVPDLVQIIHLERLIAARALLTLDQGSPRDAIASLEPGPILASSLSREPMLFAQLICIALDRINDGVILEILTRSPGLGEDDLSRLRGMLADEVPVPMQRAFLGDMKAAYKTFSDALDGRMSARLLALAGGDDSIDLQSGAVARWTYRPYGLWEMRAYLESYVVLVDELGHPRFERTRAFTLDPGQMLKGWGVFYRLAIPNLADAVLRSDLRDASRECGRTALALESYARNHGGYPETLDALVPAHMDRIPLDPFSGRPIEYRREGKGYVLRSAGDDGTFHVGLPGYDKLVVWRVKR